jgi:hypothetical protein
MTTLIRKYLKEINDSQRDVPCKILKATTFGSPFGSIVNIYTTYQHPFEALRTLGVANAEGS